MVIPKRNKSNTQVEVENLKYHRKRLDEKWKNYLTNLTKQNIHVSDTVELMNELNEFDYKLIKMSKRDLLG